MKTDAVLQAGMDLCGLADGFGLADWCGLTQTGVVLCGLAVCCKLA